MNWIKRVFCLHKWIGITPRNKMQIEASYIGYKIYKCIKCEKEIISKDIPISYWDDTPDYY